MQQKLSQYRIITVATPRPLDLVEHFPDCGKSGDLWIFQLIEREIRPSSGETSPDKSV
jgi:hypothetical protein